MGPAANRRRNFRIHSNDTAMNWYYLLNEQQVGPVTVDEILEKVSEGVISRETYVWREGMAEWLPYANVANEISQAGTPAPATGVTTASVVKCPTCGKPAAANELIPVGHTQVCPSCKEEYVQSAREGVSMGGEWEYGGFWIRTGAVMVDGMITGLAMTVLGGAVGLAVMSAVGDSPEVATSLTVILYIAIYGLVIAYYVYFNGHPRFQATPGKMALRLRLVVADGSRVTYLRAFGRLLAYMLSGMLFYIGYIMAAFDSEKRSLHDRICNTRVIKIR